MMPDPFHRDKPEQSGGMILKSLEKCSICKAFVSLAEETACALLKQANPNLDVNACKQVLHMKLDGKSNEEIAGMLKVPVKILSEVIGQSVDAAKKEIDKKIKGAS